MNRFYINKGKKYLQQIQTLNEKMIQCNLMLSEIKKDCGKITASYGASPGAGGKNNDISDYLVKLEKQIAKIEHQKGELFKKKGDIQQFIFNLKVSPTQEVCKRILILKYINNKTFDEIYDTTHYSYSYITKTLHPRALELVGKALEDTPKCS